MSVNLVCSNRPRPSVHSSASAHGNQHWTREVFHAAGAEGKTLCGIDAREWLAIEARPAHEATSDHHFCRRCAAKLNDVNQ